MKALQWEKWLIGKNRHLVLVEKALFGGNEQRLQSDERNKWSRTCGIPWLKSKNSDLAKDWIRPLNSSLSQTKMTPSHDNKRQ